MNRCTQIGVTLLVAAGAFAGEAEDRARFEAHKAAMLEDPALIRFYTFEEGKGKEVANHVVLNPARTAMTGGPLGSLTLGGRSGSDTRLGSVLGPSLPKREIGTAVKRIIDTYLENREGAETFLQTLDRIGPDPFKEQVYDNHL